jgi:uncharacterized protein
MKKSGVFVCVFFMFLGLAKSQKSLPEFPISSEWLRSLEAKVPSKATVKPLKKRSVLIFSLFTGFNHWTVPHTDEMVRILGTKTGAYDFVLTKNINDFSFDKLKSFDAVVLNNNCSKPDNRNIFYDVIAENKKLTEAEIRAKAQVFEDDLLKYVSSGGGLIVLHGGIVMQNKSLEFGTMMGGSFDYHPAQQAIDVQLVDPKHPLVKAFDGVGFTHVDEPYFFNNAYFDYNFRPLLSMESAKITGVKEAPKDKIKYVAWIKKYGAGRVFYCSPSHNPQSLENVKLLRFLLDGFQYAIGDLKCDDSPMKR